ncbi:hemicentin-2-like [Mercenaria mercenaria]|uniref:hemicentin-2-like n=1 Tax=Mercenaria mercenaria TaxID=6596 RepID=UPI001E1D6553|nr:hemicentin-2-like [Mercenaria mercenaria]
MNRFNNCLKQFIMIFLVWICIVLSVSTQVSLQQIISDLDVFKQQIYVDEGGDISVQCNTTELPDKAIYWTKNKTHTTFHRDGIFLNFTRINRTDHGQYICHSFDNKTHVLTEVETVMINVYYKAEVKSIRIHPQDAILENDTYFVYCDVEGNPPPQWRVRNNYTKELLDSARGSGPLITRSIKGKCGDTGPIVCEANNTLNKQPAYMTENFTVYCSPRPSGNYTNVSIGYVGGQAFLIMNLLGYPYPNYTWSRDDGQPIRHATQIDYPSFTVLNMTEIAVSDFGYYSVTMENAYGNFTAQFQLKAYGAPETPFNLNYSDVTWNSVRLYWTSGFDMGSRQYFFIRMLQGGNSYTTISNSIYDNSSSHGVGQNWTYLQTGLKSDTDITLTVQSVNGYGYRSRILYSVTFHTLPSPNGSRDKTKIIIGTTVASVSVVGIAAWMVAYVAYKRKRKSTYHNIN